MNKTTTHRMIMMVAAAAAVSLALGTAPAFAKGKKAGQGKAMSWKGHGGARALQAPAQGDHGPR